MPDYDKAIQFAFFRLQNQLHPLLTYHSLWHTEGDVVLAAERLAQLEGIQGEDLLLLLTAAWYHDIGFTVGRDEHEEMGVHIVKEHLPDFGYSKGQIEVVSGLIRATKLPQSPQTALEEMMSDSDLDSLGREDFLKTSLLLKAELNVFGIEKTYLEWYRGQWTFLSGHSYFRDSARSLRNGGKKENIAFLEDMIESLSP